MQPALWISKTGLSAQDTQLATIANNLANVSTTGFKKDTAVFQDLLYQIKQQPGAQNTQDNQLPSGLQIGTGVRIAASKKEFQQGGIEMTQRPLDVAISGRGFLQVQMADGSIAYTRDGQLQLNSQGQIVTSNGMLLEPNITVPQGTTALTIGRDGTVSATDPTTNQPIELGQITLVDFINQAGLQAAGDNLFKETAASGAPQAGEAGLNGLGELMQGALESSNVNIAEELVDMIQTQRAYEMNAKVISAADSMLQFVTQTI